MAPQETRIGHLQHPPVDARGVWGEQRSSLPDASRSLCCLFCPPIPSSHHHSQSSRRLLFLLWRFSDEKDELEVRAFGERPSDPDAGPQTGVIHGRSTARRHRWLLLLLRLADLHSVMDPVQELCYLGIDTWAIGLCTATTPADHPYKVPRVTTGTYQGSPAVSYGWGRCGPSQTPSTATPMESAAPWPASTQRPRCLRS